MGLGGADADTHRVRDLGDRQFHPVAQYKCLALASRELPERGNDLAVVVGDGSGLR